MTIQGIHHITIGCSDAQQTVDFYTGVLGLRFVKKTVNFDDPGTYHLYFGDRTGRPGTAVTFFEWPGVAKGHPGIGGTQHLGLRVPDHDALLKWKRYLTDRGIRVAGPMDHRYYEALYLSDPDGMILQLATDGPGWTVDEPADELGTHVIPPPNPSPDVGAIQAQIWPEPVPEITADMALSQGMHHITAICSDIARTNAFFGDLLGLRVVKKSTYFDDPEAGHWFWGVGDGQPGTIISYFERNRPDDGRARIGVGQTHHFAMIVPDEDTQLEWREKLIRAGQRVTPVLDRVYFKSIYTNDPDGHIVELATAGPGFLVDEDEAELGTNLRLPPWLEGQRELITHTLRPISVPAWSEAR